MPASKGEYQPVPQNEAFYNLVRKRTAERFRQEYVTTTSQMSQTETISEVKKKLQPFKTAPESPYSFNNALLILLSIAVFYITDAAAVVLYDKRVDWMWLKGGAACLGISILCCLYCVVYLSWIKKISSDNWEEHNRFIIPIATCTSILGTGLVTGSLWPVWGILALPIVAIEIIGFVVFIAMIPDIF